MQIFIQSFLDKNEGLKCEIFIIFSNFYFSPNEDSEVNRVHKPHPIRHILKSDFTHTFKGTIAGLIIMGAAIINLVLFFGFDGKIFRSSKNTWNNSNFSFSGRETMRDEAEYVSKISNTIINLVGIIALIIGIAELHHLETREDSADGYWDLDLFLLRFTSFFSFLYMLFTMITGAFNHHIEDFPNELHIINGLCDLLQIILQLCFIQSLKQKVTNFALFSMKNIKKISYYRNTSATKNT